MQVLYSIWISKQKWPGDCRPPGQENIYIKKPWDLLEVPTVYSLMMIFVDYGRLAPSLELSHHQFLSAFINVLFRSIIIEAHFRECQNTCQEEIFKILCTLRFVKFIFKKVIVDLQEKYEINFDSGVDCRM